MDVFLCCIAKSLDLQVKVRGEGGGGKSVTTTTLRQSLADSDVHKAPERWWMRGYTSPKLAEGIVSLLKDMAMVSASFKDYFNKL